MRRGQAGGWQVDGETFDQVILAASAAASLARACTRVRQRSVAPCAASQVVAASGSSRPRSTRGSSRSLAPGALNRASRSTRRNTLALAASAGVLSAATHSGSISSRRTCGPMDCESRATVQSAGQRKPRAIHPPAAPTRRRRSATLHCRAASNARANAGSGRPGGSIRPWPLADTSRSGRRSSTRSGSTPTVRISASVLA
jgi:hypothetical protein